MEKFNCTMKHYKGYMTVTVYGREIRTDRPKSRKMKEQIKDDLREVEENPNLSALEKMVLGAVLKQPKPERVRKRNASRTRKLTRAEKERFRDLIVMNFTDSGAKYLTLTYEKAEVTVDEASKDFENWVKRMRDRYGDFKYLAIRSFQRRGTIHFHVLATLPTIPKEELKDGTFQKIWGLGGVDVTRVYLLPFLYKKSRLQKYMMKNLAEFKGDERSYGKRLFLESKNLTKPEVWKGDYEELMDELKERGVELTEIERVRFPVDYLESMEITTYQVMDGNNELEATGEAS
ncbi:RNA replicase [Brevibacillus choshinensis]|uniref:rolling circle replication-associated protein n=1 Tax=Brevibacillus choshinensis TaxID=54911 RepID=UPI002E1CD1B7|nr:RNA replicase [Brevibacillus choshinensis]MED4784876.1 RNA replicase [Brevibacillus choshinensis]